MLAVGSMVASLPAEQAHVQPAGRAGGFVGAALAPELVARGHAVRAGTRDPGRRPAPAGAVAQRFDLDDEASLGPALDGVELAYYLVHSMAQKGEFARRDLHHAR